MLSLSYLELSEIDSIKVDLVPEKKGVILKHVEYSVTSQVNVTKDITNSVVNNSVQH